MKIAILLSNPNHHLELTRCLALQLQSKGHKVKYISICQLRRLADPDTAIRAMGIPMAGLPLKVKKLKPSAGSAVLGKSVSLKRKILQKLAWLLLLKPFINKEAKGFDVVLLMNDTAFPYNYIVEALKRQSIKTVLLQEGIRFDLPNELENGSYAQNADTVFAWGEKSAQLFRARRKSRENTVYITGSPRFDNQREMYSKLPSNQRVLGIFTNPIDDQGFLSTDEKHRLVVNLVAKISSEANEMGLKLELKPHPREDVVRYERELAAYSVNVLSCTIHEAIERAGAGIVFASTVGLELLAANRPIAQCAIPNAGFVFDYVSSGAALPINQDDPFSLKALLKQPIPAAYLEAHMYSGNACQRTVEILTNLA